MRIIWAKWMGLWLAFSNFGKLVSEKTKTNQEEDYWVFI